MDAQGVYSALMAWYVGFRQACDTEPGSGYSRARDHGHSDMLIQAAMVAFGEDADAAELRVSGDYAERMASMN